MRRLLLAAVAVTVLALGLDLSGAAALDPVRAAAAAALGPLERLVGPGSEPARESAVRAAAESAVAGAAGPDDRLGTLLATPGLAGTPVVLARVVAVGRAGPAGPELVTIDAGTRDGVEVDRTVVAADGLVGRVVGVAPWTSDVALVGSPDVAVGVRVGSAGVLGQASGSALAGAPAPRPGTLALSLVGRGSVRDGDRVVTLGSADGRPFVAGVPVGTVRGLRTDAGRLTPTGVVVPAVDVAALDVVAVVVPPARTTPRPVLTPPIATPVAR